MGKVYFLGMLMVVSLSFLNLDIYLGHEEIVVGDLEYITTTFNESAVQEYHIAKITLNTFGYEEVVNINVLSNYGSEHIIGSKVTVRINNGYFTGHRYSIKIN